jgi:peptidoglycan/xylan/chitin deacetylase (PgdA/CDA1 family)
MKLLRPLFFLRISISDKRSFSSITKAFFVLLLIFFPVKFWEKSRQKLDQVLSKQEVAKPKQQELDINSPSQETLSMLQKAIAVSGSQTWPEIHPDARRAKVPIIMYHDILPQKEVFFDVTPEELRKDFELIKAKGLTPISMDWLMAHLRTGHPLPSKPILLTFDDGYGGHYDYVYPLLKEFKYPALFSIYTEKMDLKGGRTAVTWEQLQEMAADPLVTIASHSVSHPGDLRNLSDEQLEQEIILSKKILEELLARPIHYFTYPVGKFDQRVKDEVEKAGYLSALAMDDVNEQWAGESEDLLAIARFGQSSLEKVIAQVWGGHPLPRRDGGFNFTTPIVQEKFTVKQTPIIMITGGKPNTIHAKSRYQVPEIIADTEAVAAVDGGFFSLKYLDSNVMIGPVLTHNSQEFIPGNEEENQKLRNRPLVLINDQAVKFIPFVPEQHNTRSGIQQEMLDVRDAFVGAAWLVKNGKPQPAETFGNLFDFDIARHRAFWGLNQGGQPVIGVSARPVDSVSLGKILHELGMRDAIMLDSGASTSLAYKGQSLVGYTPRPVPHVVALYPAPREEEKINLLPWQEKIPLEGFGMVIFSSRCQINSFGISGCGL